MCVYVCVCVSVFPTLIHISTWHVLTQSAGAVEYTDCFSAEG